METTTTSTDYTTGGEPDADTQIPDTETFNHPHPYVVGWLAAEEERRFNEEDEVGFVERRASLLVLPVDERETESETREFIMASNRNGRGSRTSFIGDFLAHSRNPSGAAPGGFTRTSIVSTTSTTVETTGRGSMETQPGNMDMDCNESFTTTDSGGSGHTLMPTQSGSNIPSDAVFGSVANRHSLFTPRVAAASGDPLVPANVRRGLTSTRSTPSLSVLRHAARGNPRKVSSAPPQYREKDGQPGGEHDGVDVQLRAYQGPTPADVVYFVNSLLTLLDNKSHPTAVATALNEALKSEILVKLSSGEKTAFNEATLLCLLAEMMDTVRYFGADTAEDPRVKVKDCISLLTGLRLQGIAGGDEVYVTMVEERAHLISLRWESELDRRHKEVVADAAFKAEEASHAKRGRRTRIKRFFKDFF